MGHPQKKKQVGITHDPVDQEEETQQQLPPRGRGKQGTGTRTPDRARRTELFEPRGVTAEEEASLSSRGSKGGKSRGSRAGLVSFDETKRTSKGKGLSERAPGHRNRIADGQEEADGPVG